MRYCGPPALGQVGVRERVVQRWPTKTRHNPGRVSSGKSFRPQLANFVVITATSSSPTFSRPSSLLTELHNVSQRPGTLATVSVDL